MTLLRFRALPAVCLALLLAATARAEPLRSIPNPRVQNGTWVTDTSATLDAKTVALLNERAAAFERETTSEIAIVVIRSLDGVSIEEAAVKLFEMWGIGKKNRDNGLLFLWSTGDRRVRVEVGYGLEGALPDGKVGAILDQYVIPRFKANQFDQGVLDGVGALIAVAICGIRRASRCQAASRRAPAATPASHRTRRRTTRSTGRPTPAVHSWQPPATRRHRRAHPGRTDWH